MSRPLPQISHQHYCLQSQAGSEGPCTCQPSPSSQYAVQSLTYDPFSPPPHMNPQFKSSTDPSLPPPPDSVSAAQYTHSYFSNPQIPVSTAHLSQSLSAHHHHNHAAQQQQQQHPSSQHPHGQQPNHQAQQHHLMQPLPQGRKRRASGPLMSLDVNTLHAPQHQMGQQMIPDDGKSTLMTSTGVVQMIPMTVQPTTPTQAMSHSQGMMPGSMPTPTSAGRPKSAKRSRTNVPWTAAEEMRLKEMREKGISWSVIAQSFPNRTEGGVKKHWYKDMHFAEFARDEVRKTSRQQPRTFSEALVQALKEYDADRWKIVGQKVGKPAKACEQYIRENYPYLLKPDRNDGGMATVRGPNPSNSMPDMVPGSMSTMDPGLKNLDPTPT